MEFYLINRKNVKITSELFGVVGLGTTSDRLSMSPSPMNVSVETVTPPLGGGSKYAEYLESSLVVEDASLKKLDCDNNVSRKLKIEFVVHGSERNDGVRIYSDSKGKINILERLREVHGEHHVVIKISVKDFGFGGETNFGFQATGLQIQNLSRNKKKTLYGVEYLGIKFPGNIYPTVQRGGEFVAGSLTVIVKLNHQAVNSLYLEGFMKQELYSANKIMLQEATCSDLVITAGNGAKIKCHKAMLSVKSEVFRAMFESDMVEATTNSLEMLDMTEESVRAFLAFIYHWDLTGASEHCEIALQLLGAGHKYGISEMEDAMWDIMLAKPNDWFTVDTTLKLLLFAQNVGSWYNWLKTKAVQVLKEKPDELFDSSEFKALFEKHPKKAMEVSAEFLKFSS